MAVYAKCEKCDDRRERCADPSAHKRYVGWWADVRVGGSRLRKYYNSKVDNPKELADKQSRAWLTDYERGALHLVNGTTVTFGTLADKYWSEHALAEIRHPERTILYGVRLAKEWIGADRKAGPLSDTEFQEFQNDMRRLQRRLRVEGLAGSTINRYFNTIRSIFERGREWGLVKQNPLEFVGRVQEDEPAARFLEQKEIDHLFDTAAQLKDDDGRPITQERIQRLSDFMTVISHTGARPSSIEECSWNNGDVDLVNKVIWFTTYKGGQRKKHRYPVPIDEVLFPLVLRRAEATGRQGKVFDCSGLRRLEELCVEQSKINEGKPENRWFTMYGLKHCYASHLLMRGATTDEVGALLGHTDGRMVRKHYGHMTLEHLRKVQSKINLTPMVQLKVV